MASAAAADESSKLTEIDYKFLELAFTCLKSVPEVIILPSHQASASPIPFSLQAAAVPGGVLPSPLTPNFSLVLFCSLNCRGEIQPRHTYPKSPLLSAQLPKTNDSRSWTL